MDVFRFFTGDMPALAAESGQQYGGNFPCGNCGSPAVMFDDFGTSSPQQHATEEKPTSTAHNSTYDTQTPKRKVRRLTSPVNSMLTPPHTPAEQYTYRTKLGAALAKLFGTNDKDTIALDKAKHASKQQPTSRILKSKFQEMESKA